MSDSSDEQSCFAGADNAGNEKISETENQKCALATRRTAVIATNVPKPGAIARRLCHTVTLTSAVLGALIRVAKKRDPEFFVLRRPKGENTALVHETPQEATRAKKALLLKRLWRGAKTVATRPFKLLGGLLLGWIFYRELKKSGFDVSFSVAERIAIFWSDKKGKKTAHRPTLYRRVKYWFFLNVGLVMADIYLKENDLSLADAKRTYDLCRRFIKAIVSDGNPEKTFEQLLDFASARRRETKWGYFDTCQGGLFSPQVQEVVIVILQFGPECSKTLFGSFRQLTENVDPDVKQAFREIRDEILASTGLQSIADVANRSVLRLLGDYCTKMRKDAKQHRDRERIEKWTHAQQALTYLSSHTPIPSNDAAIETHVREFARRADLAGAATYAVREIDAEDETYEVPVSMAARILGVNRREIHRWENPDGKHPCPVPGYDKKLRRKEAAFMGWSHKYTMWKEQNRRERNGKDGFRH